VQALVSQWQPAFAAGGARLSLQRAQGSYWVQVDTDPSLAVGQPVAGERPGASAPGGVCLVAGVLKWGFAKAAVRSKSIDGSAPRLLSLPLNARSGPCRQTQGGQVIDFVVCVRMSVWGDGYCCNPPCGTPYLQKKSG